MLAVLIGKIDNIHKFKRCDQFTHVELFGVTFLISDIVRPLERCNRILDSSKHAVQFEDRLRPDGNTRVLASSNIDTKSVLFRPFDTSDNFDFYVLAFGDGVIILALPD